MLGFHEPGSQNMDTFRNRPTPRTLICRRRGGLAVAFTLRPPAARRIAVILPSSWPCPLQEPLTAVHTAAVARRSLHFLFLPPYGAFSAPVRSANDTQRAAPVQ